MLRDQEDIDVALHHLRSARRLAERTGDGDRLADVRGTLGATLAVRGRTAAALRELDAAVVTSSQGGAVQPKVLMRRANVLAYAGHHDAAIDDLHEAVRGFRRWGEEVWEARALNLRAYVRISRAQFAEAERDLHEADALFVRREQHLEVRVVRHNLALIPGYLGRRPGSAGGLRGPRVPARGEHR